MGMLIGGFVLPDGKGGEVQTFESELLPGVTNITHSTSGDLVLQYRWSGAPTDNIWTPIWSPNAQNPFFAPFAETDDVDPDDGAIDLGNAVLSDYAIRAVRVVSDELPSHTVFDEVQFGKWRNLGGGLIRNGFGHTPLGVVHAGSWDVVVLYQIRRESDERIIAAFTVTTRRVES